MQLKINPKDGEDLKSKRNSNYYKNLNDKFPQWKDDTTIAYREMDIDLNIVNKTQSSWVLNAISLIIVEQKETQKNKIYTWPYRIRGEEDSIDFKISNNKNSFIYIPSNILISKPNEGDNLLNINIQTDETGLEKKHIILSFKLELNLTEIGKTNTIKIPSDKIYHLCMY
ncbi:hypothetical protein Q4Q34_04200 [Flavivirga abyssicola]|uniref:hypothetical protein n=1 Tax=Flavivirga abyssicola TaxID=3063533 RepID=UPI0026E05A53|nr:hypothetical protein [Flavivirga sp. MEBiC07777]WVK14229.1 hypothetical protein Q4Q34_04200 [Flavivirga sp. MEBiC07777]